MRCIYYSPRFHPSMGLTSEGARLNASELERTRKIQAMAVIRHEDFYFIKTENLDEALSLSAVEIPFVKSESTPCCNSTQLWVEGLGSVFILPFSELRLTNSGNLLVCVYNTHPISSTEENFYYFASPKGEYVGYCTPEHGDYLVTACPKIVIDPLPEICEPPMWEPIETVYSIPEGIEKVDDVFIYRAYAGEKVILLATFASNKTEVMPLSLADYWKLRMGDYLSEDSKQWEEIPPNFATLRKRYNMLKENGIAQLKRECGKGRRSRSGKTRKRICYS